MLAGKRILLGVSGSIAAYKTPWLVRLLVKAGAEVQVIMTPAAKEFVTPLTLSTVSQKPVYSDFEKNDHGQWVNHVALGTWANLMLIAPASANTLAKMAHGLCDNLMMAVVLSARCPVMVSPAMDVDMHRHPATKANIISLETLGFHIIPAAEGELASGLSGVGRMPEPEELLEAVQTYFGKNMPLQGKKAMVTAGPTVEAIDPVRYISNHSSGKMGIAVAESLCRMGADVTLVHGPVTAPLPGWIKTIPVTDSQQMLEACLNLWPTMDVAVMAAAVADYRPTETAKQKIKKSGETIHLELIKTMDVLAELGKSKQAGQKLVGFALETENELENARKKLIAKNADLIVLNSLNEPGAGFGHATNKVSIIAHNSNHQTPLLSKKEIADEIVKKILELLA